VRRSAERRTAVSDDVVVQERGNALWRAGLRRHHVEVVRWRVGLDVEVEESHLALDPVHPDHLDAGQCAGLIAVRQPRRALSIVLILVVRTRLLVNIATNGCILRARQRGKEERDGDQRR
jgi:hypothetical protein